jgi:hypothetical protein
MIDASGYTLRASFWQVALLGVAVVVLGCDPMPNWPDTKHGTYLRIEPDSLTLAEGRVGTLRTKSDGEFVWGIRWSVEGAYLVSLADVYGTANSVTTLAPGVGHVTVDAVRNKDQVVLWDTATVVVLPVTPRTLAISPDSLLIPANPLATGGSLHGVLRDSVGVEIPGRWRSWSWTSSDTSIVTLWVDRDNALVHGMRIGHVVVTARVGQVVDSALVIVGSIQ